MQTLLPLCLLGVACSAIPTFLVAGNAASSRSRKEYQRSERAAVSFAEPLAHASGLRQMTIGPRSLTEFLELMARHGKLERKGLKMTVRPDTVSQVVGASRSYRDVEVLDLRMGEGVSPLEIDWKELMGALPEGIEVHAGFRSPLLDDAAFHSFVEATPGLSILMLQGVSVSSIAPLAGRTNLEVLMVEPRQVQDFSILGSMTGLVTLGVGVFPEKGESGELSTDEHVEAVLPESNPLDPVQVNPGEGRGVDLSFAARLEKLQNLVLPGFSASSLAPLAGLEALRCVELYSIEEGTDLSPLIGSGSMQKLRLHQATLEQIKSLRRSRNPIMLIVQEMPEGGQEALESFLLQQVQL